MPVRTDGGSDHNSNFVLLYGSYGSGIVHETFVVHKTFIVKRAT